MIDSDGHARRVAAVVMQTRDVVTGALEFLAREMESRAEKARAAYEAGQDDPAVGAEQDRSLITNVGYRHLAETQGQRAERAREAAARIEEALNND